ncbi:MAG: hypothetical protein C0518_11365 [Opitutus sp.]|nr:hypothetical protein [Opitutus sp.]
MRTLARNILAVVLGFLIGGFVNMALVTAGPKVFAPPAGTDMTTAAGIAAAIPLLEPQHFLFPFLAHAANAFVGALVAYLFAVTRRELLAWIIGGLTLCGGIAASVMIPAPAWFKAVDLLLAYLPMTWLAIQLGKRIASGSPAPTP